MIARRRPVSILALLALSALWWGCGGHACACGPTSAPQQPVHWIRDHVLALDSIEPATDENDSFEDLEPLAEVLEGVRVVLLGEQSHGDGTTFLAKARLVQFLHQRLGFDVLAFESGMYDCLAVHTALKTDVPTPVVGAYGLYGVWTLSQQFQPVLAYARRTLRQARPLEIAGFDCQFSSRRGRCDYPGELIAFLRKPGPEVLDESLARSFLEAFDHYGEQLAFDDRVREDLLGILDRLREVFVRGHARLSRVHSLRDIAFFERTLENLYVSVELRGLEPRRNQRENARDRRMAENFLWLCEEHYRGRKIIGWGAQSHFLDAADELQPPGRMRFAFENMHSMAELLRAELGDAMYSIAFTAGGGESGIAFREVEPLEPVAPDSFEDLFRRAGVRYGLLDLRAAEEAHWLDAPRLARPVFNTFCRARWPDQVDGLFFLERLAPSEPIAHDLVRAVQEVNRSR